MKAILDAGNIKDIIGALVQRIAADYPHADDVVVVGIRSRGEVLAKRLAAQMSQQLGETVECGTLDITLYRDDINDPHGNAQPVVRTTEIEFGIDDRTVILVDDVLFTGRSTRAAMDALIDLGRPRAIRLAVLIDRTGREFPIQADYTGHHIDVCTDERVHVHFIESDGTDEVFVEKD